MTKSPNMLNLTLLLARNKITLGTYFFKREL